MENHLQAQPAFRNNGNLIYDHLHRANEGFPFDGYRILPCRPRLSKMNTMLQDLFLGSSSSKQEQQYRHGAQNESKTSTLRKLWAYLTILSHCLSATSHLSCRLLDMVPVSPLPIPLF